MFFFHQRLGCWIWWLEIFGVLDFFFCWVGLGEKKTNTIGWKRGNCLATLIHRWFGGFDLVTSSECHLNPKLSRISFPRSIHKKKRLHKIFHAPAPNVMILGWLGLRSPTAGVYNSAAWATVSTICRLGWPSGILRGDCCGGGVEECRLKLRYYIHRKLISFGLSFSFQHGWLLDIVY